MKHHHFTKKKHVAIKKNNLSKCSSNMSHETLQIKRKQRNQVSWKLWQHTGLGFFPQSKSQKAISFLFSLGNHINKLLKVNYLCN